MYVSISLHVMGSTETLKSYLSISLLWFNKARYIIFGSRDPFHKDASSRGRFESSALLHRPLLFMAWMSDSNVGRSAVLIKIALAPKLRPLLHKVLQCPVQEMLSKPSQGNPEIVSTCKPLFATSSWHERVRMKRHQSMRLAIVELLFFVVVILSCFTASYRLTIEDVNYSG